MKKSLIFVSFLLLFSFNLTAQNIKNNESLLLGRIQEIELKKKEVIDIYNNIAEARISAVEKTAARIADKKFEIDAVPYRFAELLYGSNIPSNFALNRRKNIYDKVKNQFINNCELQLKKTEESQLQRQFLLLDEINKEYEYLKSKKLSSEDGELEVTYSGYDGHNICWEFNVALKSDDITVENKGILTFKELTGKDPLIYSEEDFDGFCDYVDYYNNMFSTEISDSLFELECGAVPLDINHPSQYNIQLKSLTWNNGKNSAKMIIEEPESVVSINPAYNLQTVISPFPEIGTLIEKEVKEVRLNALGFYFLPEYLPSGTDGSVGTEGNYVLFGYWPQSLKSDDVTFIDKRTEDINGWTCYLGSDGCYYVKVTARPYNESYKFSNGKTINENTEYYFKMEPIKWRVLADNYQGGKLLLAENILINSPFEENYRDEERDYYFVSEGRYGGGPEIIHTENKIVQEEVIKKTVNENTFYLNNYKYSSIRAYLNGFDGSGYEVDNFTDCGFINRAFSPESIKIINTVNVDNGVESTTDSDNNLRKAYDYICEDTDDKVFLLSEKEITDNDYGFDYYYSDDPSRKRKVTDYFLAMGGLKSEDSCSWWLRSPNDVKACVVDFEGNADSSYSLNASGLGVVPALSISSDYFSGSEVSDLTITATDKKVMFSWKNPDEESFKKVIISMKGIKDIEIFGEKGAVSKKTLTGLTAGKNYKFTIKTVTKNGVISKGITADVLMKDVPPADVLNADFVKGNKRVSFSWINPSDLDFSKVIISGLDSGDIEVTGLPEERKEITLENLSNNTEYSVVIKTVDKAGNTGDGICFSFTTNIISILPAGTDGSAGTEGTYVLFGNWPQTIKADDVTVSSESVFINGWNCYIGSDKCYYVKKEAETNYSDYKFSNGVSIESGKEYYFKLEPIKWRVITDYYQGGKLLLAENVLISKQFDTDRNNYKDSEIRTWLNNDFINKAFTKDDISTINTVTVYNGADSTTDSGDNLSKAYVYCCENTEDKVFLLSEEEATMKDYGFDGYNSYSCPELIRKSTDYSRAGKLYMKQDTDYGSWWWLRSPSRDYNRSRLICYDGDSNETREVDIDWAGVVPALSVSF